MHIAQVVLTDGDPEVRTDTHGHGHGVINKQVLYIIFNTNIVLPAVLTSSFDLSCEFLRAQFTRTRGKMSAC